MIKLTFLLKFVICVTLINVNVPCTTCIVVSDNYDTALADLDGQALISLGRKLNKPLLTILGMTINKFHTCSEWSQWSTCKASVLQYFGTRSRQRKCQKRGKTNKEKTNENDFSLCERALCPNDYNITENGFCMKFYDTIMKQAAAEKRCQNDGGHLVNIDSGLKHEDVKKYLHGIKQLVLVDGRRQDVKSPWKYKYGLQRRYIKWAPGQPHDESISLCLVLDESDTRFLHDRYCERGYPFLCEIPTL